MLIDTLVAKKGYNAEGDVLLQLWLCCAGVTCHFCRQKKLCGEEECQRCSKRDVEKDCTGAFQNVFLT